ncbi:MAG: serine/threonine protein kinase [Deltaproteobacteria bacterium]|nr:serine/threonine protein kinase [Deltaproteobacteria bacterium]
MTKSNVSQSSFAGAKHAGEMDMSEDDGWDDAMPQQLSGDTLGVGEDAPTDQDDFSPLAPGTILGSYRIEALLGRGGMGAVYRGTHIRLRRRVALKVLHPELVHNRKICDRFFSEARAVNQVRHANVVEVTDIFDQEPIIKYFIMEYLEGSPLSEELKRRGALPFAEVLHFAQQISDALAQVHAAGIVHRDLKPDNLFVMSGDDGKTRIKVLDFGVAKNTLAGIEAKTASGVLIGTPQYMSPEQLNGQPVSERADIYALGLILYEMAVGRRVFSAKSFGDAVLQHMTIEAPRVSSDLNVPGAFDDLVQRCLRKDPTERPSSMTEVHQAILDMQQNAMLSPGDLSNPLSLPPHTVETISDIHTKGAYQALEEQISGTNSRRQLALGFGLFVFIFGGIFAFSFFSNGDLETKNTTPTEAEHTLDAENVQTRDENAEKAASLKELALAQEKQIAAEAEADAKAEAEADAAAKAEADAKAKAEAEAKKKKYARLQTIANDKVKGMTTMQRLELVQECAARKGSKKEKCAEKVLSKAKRVKSLPLDEARAFPSDLKRCAIRCAR